MSSEVKTNEALEIQGKLYNAARGFDPRRAAYLYTKAKAITPFHEWLKEQGYIKETSSCGS